jgi:hypothetical protein
MHGADHEPPIRVGCWFHVVVAPVLLAARGGSLVLTALRVGESPDPPAAQPGQHHPPERYRRLQKHRGVMLPSHPDFHAIRKEDEGLMREIARCAALWGRTEAGEMHND